MTTRDTPILAGLRAALALEHPAWAQSELAPLQDLGLAHLHVRLIGTGVLARIPKQSQLGLPPEANLRHQQACFDRAQPGQQSPRLIGILPVNPALPRGALLVEEIEGRPVRLPDDLAAIAQALAAVHRLALPPPKERQPLQDANDPLRELHAEIRAQAAYMDAACLSAEAHSAIECGLHALDALVAQPQRPPHRLIAFDAHPGNFLLRADGQAVLVDLEKCRYSYPGLDLAHATLYTSTTWDVAVRAALTPVEVRDFYAAWAQTVDGALADASRPWHVPLRRAMWLWSISWCCKWRVLSQQAPRQPAQGEDWSAENSEPDLVRHVRERVDHYLSAAAIDWVQAEHERLAAMLDA